ncbi:MAG: thiamine diphosphokinase [Vallitaleaceae bacterium]|nr:thiamine diphosphokinase [Vallitaleaceae bacterium]
MVAIVVSGGKVALRELEHCISRYRNKGKIPFIIGVDKGVEALDILHLQPNLIMGDFDSVNPEILAKYQELEQLRYHSEKNATDTHLAIAYLIEQGFADLLLFGATGTRWDHSLANLFLALQYEGIRIRIVDENNLIELYRLMDEKEEKSFEFQKESDVSGSSYAYLSIVPMEATMIQKTQGVKYPLKEALLSPFDSYGVSNEILGEEAEVYIKTGKGFLIQSKD